MIDNDPTVLVFRRRIRILARKGVVIVSGIIVFLCAMLAVMVLAALCGWKGWP